MMYPNNTYRWQPLIISLLSLFIFVSITYKYELFLDENIEADAKNILFERLILKKSFLERALYSRVYNTKGIAACITFNPNIRNDEFYSLAKELIQNDSVISTMSISRNCIINAIYPQVGHEEAIGLDLLAHPQRKIIVEKTIETHKTFIAGPVELVEGGIAFVSYTPIFEKNIDNTSKFWGMTDIVIYKDKLFEEINLFETDDYFQYALKGVDGKGENGNCFWGDSSIFEKSYVSVEVLLPTGQWVLAGSPISKWNKITSKANNYSFLLYIIALITSILIYLLTKSMLRIKSNEKELKNSHLELQKLNSTKDKFFSIIAHDLKSPFNVLMGLSDLLLKLHTSLNAKETEKMLISINQTSEQTYNLLENLLLWSRSQLNSINFYPENFKIKEGVHDTIALMEIIALKKEIEITSNLSQEQIVFGDINMINLIFRNIISNAIKFTHKKGLISINIQEHSDEYIISITDTGIGIEKKYLHTMFKIDSKHSTLGTEDEKGTGLGLTLCHEFISKQNGKIWIESEIDKGSTFLFTLPKGKVEIEFAKQ